MKTTLAFVIMVMVLFVVERQNYNPHQYAGTTMGECIARTMLFQPSALDRHDNFTWAAHKVTLPQIVTTAVWKSQHVDPLNRKWANEPLGYGEAIRAASENITNM
jgi:hypothetical protein